MITKGYEVQVLDNVGFVRYIDHFGSDERIVESARISYKAASKGAEADKKLIHYLWKNRHTSPFEQCNITFNIKMPVFVMRQFVRHRTFRLNEVSARYTELPDEFYYPDSWRKQDIKNKQGSVAEENFNPTILEFSHGGVNTSAALKFHCENSYNLYQKMLKAGIAREMARMVLPVNIYTEIYVNCDLHNLMHFLILRDDNHAQFEIQEIAKAMKAIAKELYPFAFEALDKFKMKLVEES